MDTESLKQERIRDSVEFRRALILGCTLLGVMALVGTFYLYTLFLTRKYMAPFYLDKLSIVFGESDVKTLVDDPDQVKIFRTAIINAEDLRGHHSHPGDKIMFYFLEEPSKLYFL